jgi:hypothetical protein
MSGSSRLTRPPAGSQSSRRSKSQASPELPPDAAFTNRFSSILFSLYNPHIAVDLAPIRSKKPDAHAPKAKPEKLPPFDSPLCSFKVKSDLRQSQAEQDQVVSNFDRRSEILLAELGKKEYDIEVSMVPYDVERTGADRMSQKSASDKSKKKKADDASSRITSPRSVVDGRASRGSKY